MLVTAATGRTGWAQVPLADNAARKKNSLWGCVHMAFLYGGSAVMASNVITNASKCCLPDGLGSILLWREKVNPGRHEHALAKFLNGLGRVQPPLGQAACCQGPACRA